MHRFLRSSAALNQRLAHLKPVRMFPELTVSISDGHSPLVGLRDTAVSSGKEEGMLCVLCVLNKFYNNIGEKVGGV